MLIRLTLGCAHEKKTECKPLYSNKNKIKPKKRDRKKKKNLKKFTSYFPRLSKSPVRCVQVAPVSNAPLPATPVSIALTSAKVFQDPVLVTADQTALSFVSHLCLGVWSQTPLGRKAARALERTVLFGKCVPQLQCFAEVLCS